ncbi:unnamed protein product [Leptidea sinapis]|uniref:Glycosyl transferase 64 domain-containing protein n=1 Tax=Leptidea sinapis TaxID=189913 RepID=A0A5E4QWJ5_9NEOP|nr:unnamed protein product [Leptidea sinapis]
MVIHEPTCPWGYLPRKPPSPRRHPSAPSPRPLSPLPLRHLLPVIHLQHYYMSKPHPRLFTSCSLMLPAANSVKSERAAPSLKALSRLAGDARDPLPVTVVDATTHYPGEGVSARWRPLWAIPTAAVFSLDGDAPLIAEELDFAFRVWQNFPDRIGVWGYSSKWGGSYSMVLPGAAVVHRAGLALYAAAAPALRLAVRRAHNCEDILLNYRRGATPSTSFRGRAV